MPKTMQNGQPGNYNLVPETREDGEASAFEFTSTGELKVSASINAGDIELGAVEIKDGASDTRATIETAGADGSSNTQNNLTVTSRLKGFNGTTWDRLRTAVIAVSSTLTGFLNTLPWSIYKTSPTVRTDGQGGPLLSDVDGNLKTTQATAQAGENLPQDTVGVSQKPVVSSVYSGLAFADFGTVAKINVTTVPTQLKSFHVQNENAAIRYFQIFNLAAAPTDDVTVPSLSFAIPAGTAAAPGILTLGSDFFGEGGYYLSAGLSWGISVDPDVFDETGITAGEHQVNGIRI